MNPKSGGVFSVDRGLTFDTLDNALQWAVANHGIAIADHFLAKYELISGTLVAAVPEIYPSGVSYYLVYRQKLSGDTRLQAFAEWIKSALSLAMPPTASSDQRQSNHFC